jgi:hypothetical protein
MMISGGYFKNWPTATRHILAPGTAPFSARVQASIARRLARFRTQLANLELKHFGHAPVKRVLQFWNVSLQDLTP